MKDKNFHKINEYLHFLPLSNQTASQNGINFAFTNITFSIVNEDKKNLNVSFLSGANNILVNLTNSHIDLFSYYTITNGTQ